MRDERAAALRRDAARRRAAAPSARCSASAASSAACSLPGESPPSSSAIVARADARRVEQPLARRQRHGRRARGDQRAAALGVERRGGTRSPSTRTETRIRSPQSEPPAAPSWAPGSTTPRPWGAARCSVKRSRSTSAESTLRRRRTAQLGEAGLVEAASSLRGRGRQARLVARAGLCALDAPRRRCCAAARAPSARGAAWARRSGRRRRDSPADSARRRDSAALAAFLPRIVGCDQRSSAVLVVRADRVGLGQVGSLMYGFGAAAAGVGDRLVDRDAVDVAGQHGALELVVDDDDARRLLRRRGR